MNRQPGLEKGKVVRPAPAAHRGVRRTRGQSAGLDLGRIIAAARSLDPNAITMQAVAEALGVDRSAINNHVSNKDALLALVALDTFSEHFATVRIGPDRRWQVLCRTYALGFAGSVIATGALAEHLPGWGALISRFLHPFETVLSSLIDAGFDDETAIRILAMLNNICLQYAQDHIAASRSGERPRPAALREALAKHDADEFTNLARIAANPPNTYDIAQLEMSLDIFIRGTEVLAGEGTLPRVL